MFSLRSGPAPLCRLQLQSVSPGPCVPAIPEALAFADAIDGGLHVRSVVPTPEAGVVLLRVLVTARTEIVVRVPAVIGLVALQLMQQAPRPNEHWSEM